MLLTLRHHPTSVVSWGDETGFGLVTGSLLSLVVDPDSRGRGVGSALMEYGAAESLIPAPAEAWAHGSHPAAGALAERWGWVHDRSLWKMVRAADVTPVEVGSAPAGVTVRGFEPADASALLAVNAAAFAFHPEQGQMSADDLAVRMAEPWFSADGLLLAFSESSGELLGFHWTKQHTPTEGEVYVIGVSPSAQDMGLGRHLLQAGLAHLADRGMSTIHLYVEANNAPAIALYGSFGFQPVETHAHYRHD